MVLVRMQAGRKGVQPLQTMCQTMLNQKLQRAIHNRRLVAESFCCETVQNLIGAHRAMGFQQDFQRAPPDRCQPRALGRQNFLRHVQRMCLTGVMIVRRKSRAGKGCRMCAHGM